MRMDEVDFEIFGDDTQYVEIELDPGEAAVGEAGTMYFMEQGIEMSTVFGDGSQRQEGIMDKLFGAGKRLLSGESLFITVYRNVGSQKQRAAFAAPFPGKIIPLSLKDYGGSVICQKESFLCGARGVGFDIVFQRRLGTGFFGGEGFIMQRLFGDGLVFIHAGGTLTEKTLAPGEVLRVDTGCVVAYQSEVDFDIQYVGNLKSAFFGGEGLFYAVLKGPGKVWLQSLPFSRLADRVLMRAPSNGGKATGEGSLLGGLGGLLDGDNR